MVQQLKLAGGFLLSLAIVAFGNFLQAADAIQAELDKEIREYQASVQDAKDLVRKILKTDSEQAQRAGDLNALTKVKAELEKFERTGTPPDSISSRPFDSRIHTARKKAERAFENAIREYTREGKIELALEVQNKLKQFQANGTMTSSGVSLFDGTTLKGWNGLPQYWSVENGAIVGTRPAAGSQAVTYLVTENVYGDFELEFDVLLTIDDTDSGIVFRGAVSDTNSYNVTGGHANLENGGWGNLSFQGSANGKIKTLQKGNQNAAAKHLRKAGYNHIKVRCVGKDVKIQLNGQTIVSERIPELEDRGVVGFQLWKISPSQVRFKDIRLTEL